MKIKILNNIAKEGLAILDSNNFQAVTEDVDPFGIVLRSHDLTELEICKNLLGIARAGAGTNNINIEECSKHGVVVFNTPGANANAVKEMVICSLILSRRDLVSGNKNLDLLVTENKSDQEISTEIEGMKKIYQGEEVKGKTLGVIGLGAIGSMVAEQSMSLPKDIDCSATIEPIAPRPITPRVFPLTSSPWYIFFIPSISVH